MLPEGAEPQIGHKYNSATERSRKFRRGPVLAEKTRNAQDVPYLLTTEQEREKPPERTCGKRGKVKHIQAARE